MNDINRLQDMYTEYLHDSNLRRKLTIDESNIHSCIYCKHFYKITMADQCDIPLRKIRKNPRYLQIHDERHFDDIGTTLDRTTYGTPTILNSFTKCPYFEYRFIYKIIVGIKKILCIKER